MPVFNTFFISSNQYIHIFLILFTSVLQICSPLHQSNLTFLYNSLQLPPRRYTCTSSNLLYLLPTPQPTYLPSPSAPHLPGQLSFPTFPHFLFLSSRRSTKTSNFIILMSYETKATPSTLIPEKWTGLLWG